MEGLSQVNLLVGKNNSGKTALLEGLQFLTSGGDPGVLGEVAYRRGEVVARPRDKRDAPLFEVAHFFHGHGCVAGSSFSIRDDNADRAISLKVVEPRANELRDEAEGVSSSGLKLQISGGLHPKPMLLPLTRQGGVDLDVGISIPRPDLTGRSERKPARFVGTDSLGAAAVAAMWDEVLLAGLEDDVCDALRVIEPSVQSVGMLTGVGSYAYGYYPTGASRGGVVLAIGEHKGRVPLGSLGDGMWRLLSLATALACTKDGVLFVDEIDTGLHYSVMVDMWKLVVSRAMACNVQIFATTHSWDCIEGLSLLCQREPDFLPRIAIHKIDRSLPHSVAFSGSSIVRMIRGDIDPR
jgi:hypothetical protein